FLGDRQPALHQSEDGRNVPRAHHAEARADPPLGAGPLRAPHRTPQGGLTAARRPAAAPAAFSAFRILLCSRGRVSFPRTRRCRARDPVCGHSATGPGSDPRDTPAQPRRAHRVLLPESGRHRAHTLRLRRRLDLGADLARNEARRRPAQLRSEEHTSELQSRENLVCRLLLEKKKTITSTTYSVI